MWLKQTFTEADKNGDGSLSISEVLQLLHKLNVNLPRQKVKQMFKVPQPLLTHVPQRRCADELAGILGCKAQTALERCVTPPSTHWFSTMLVGQSQG